MSKGYIKLHRKIESSGLMQMPNTFTLFAFLLLKATHKKIKIGTPTGVVELERGEYISGRKKLALDLKQSEREVRTSLRRLHELEMITSKTTNRYSIYTIENYNKYQDSDQQGDQQTTSKRPTDDQQATTKQEHKNIKTEEDKTKAKKADAFILPDWINKTHWDVWHETPKRKKATDGQKQMAVDKLLKMKEAGIDYALALENAAVGGYQGIFAPKANAFNQPQGGSQSSKRAATEAAKRRLFGDQQEKDITNETTAV